MTRPALLGLRQVVDLVHARELSPVDVVRDVLDRIERINPRLNAYITVLADEALDQARRLERSLARKKSVPGPLAGATIAVKDLFYTKGVRTTAGSRILADFIPAYDATAVARLKEAGAIIIGKSTMHEFALGVTSENPFYGPSRNPWDPSRVSGGSSGGSAVAVAAGLCHVALGTDTGGSIRIPASFCGVVGLKPTFGRVSTHGVIPLGWSMDHVGPLTRTVEDAALLLQVLASADPKDPACSIAPVEDYFSSLKRPLQGLRMGVPQSYFFENVETEVVEAVSRAIGALEELGVERVEVPLPDMEQLMAAWNLILGAESAAYHEDWLREQPQGYSQEVRARLEPGRFLPATAYLKAQQARQRLVEEFLPLFEGVDVLVTPTMPVLPEKIGETVVSINGATEDVVSALGRLTRPFNLLGFPAISDPCGFSQDGLPIGLQLVGRPWGEALLLRVAHQFYHHVEPGLRRQPKLIHSGERRSQAKGRSRMKGFPHEFTSNRVDWDSSSPLE